MKLLFCLEVEILKLSILTIFEGFFQPEIAKNTKNSAPIPPNQEGPSDFPYHSKTGDILSDEEIEKELKLELKLGNVMRDPKNLPNHNVHNGSFSWGKSSKTYGSYLTNSADEDLDPSRTDVMVNNIEEGTDLEQDEAEEFDEYIKKAIENRDRARREAIAARKKLNIKSKRWEKATAPIKNEDIGTRDKAQAYGAQITTMKPFANGVPQKTQSGFMDEDEIAKELGLTEMLKLDLSEWISSSLLFNRPAKGEKDDLNFFDKNNHPSLMATEEEFNKNQRKMGKNVKTKKRR